MNKILKIIIAVLAAVIAGIIFGIIKGSVIVYTPQYTDKFNHFVNISVILAISLIVISIFIYLGATTLNEMRFFTLYTDELYANGAYSEKILKEINKRKQKNKKKNLSVYLQSINFLAQERLLHSDPENALKQYDEIDINDLYLKFKINSKRSKLNDICNFANMIDMLMCLYMITNDTKIMETLKIYLDELKELYFDKYPEIRLTINEAYLYYFFTNKDTDNFNINLKNIEKFPKDDETVIIVNLIVTLMSEYLNNNLDINKFNDHLKETKAKTDNVRNKIYFDQKIEYIGSVYKSLFNLNQYSED